MQRHDADPERVTRAQADETAEIARAIAASRIRFLMNELSIGHTMLDAADVARDLAARTRRIANARAAHDEVARHLASDDAPRLTEEERSPLRAGLAVLTTRLEEQRSALEFALRAAEARSTTL